MTGRRLRAAALAALLLLLLGAGCGRKAKPEPRRVADAPVGHHGIYSEVTKCIISR